ncbi:ABC transporter substrate-binding protein/permease [Acetobacter sacchari]
MRRTGLLGVLIAGLVTMLATISARAEAPPSFAANGTLTACTNPTLPPMTFVNGAEASALAGFDIDLVREIAGVWNLRPDIVQMDFEGMFPSLSAGRCGMVISGVMRQATRERNFDAIPYYESAMVVIARTGTPKISSFSELSGQTVAIETGTSYGRLIEIENAALAARGKPPIRVQLYPSEDQVIQQVLLGRAHAAMSQDVEVLYRRRQLGGKVTTIFKPDIPDFHDFAIYIRKDSVDKARLEQAVDELRRRGTLTALAHKWNIDDTLEEAAPTRGAPSRFDVQTFLSALVSRAFFKGASMTLIMALLSHVTAIAISIPIALALNGRRSLIQPVLSAYVAVFRGAPTLLQLLFIWNALPQFLPIFRESWFTPFLAAWISLSINESAYQVEINRAALRAVDRGQSLAAEALGMKKSHVYWHIVFPQALRIALPPTINDFISLLKTTSLASVISLQELLAVTQIQVARTFQFTEYYSAALVWYLGIVFFFLYVQKRIERRFTWADRDKAAAHDA